MDYEKKYKEALERAKEKYTKCYSPALLDYIFPELKSEDVEIRRSIIRNLKRYIKCMKDGYDVPSAKDFVKEIEKQIAWLEKQGEQEFINSDTHIQQRVDTLADIDAKQSSADNVKPKVKNDIEIPFGAKDSELQEATYYIPKGFYAEIDDDKVVIKKGEKHTAWSEENRKRIQRISDFIWKNRKGDTDDIYQQEQDVKWLKSFRPQPKQEWSEEDECCMAECINAIATKDGWSFEEKRKTKHWLKSLKDRVSCEANYITTKEWSEEDERNMQNISLNLV